MKENYERTRVEESHPRYSEHMYAEWESFEEAAAAQRQTYNQKPRRAANALLDPAEFDNYKLWQLFHDNNVHNTGAITAIAKEIGFGNISSTHLDYFPDVDIFYPTLWNFIFQIQCECTNSSVIIEQVLASCFDPLTQKSLRDMFLGKNNDAEKDQDNKNKEIPFAQPKAPATECRRGELAADLAQFIGHPDNTFNDQYIKNDISMQILGLFIAAVGIAMIAVAFTVLNAATLGMSGVAVAGVGIVSTLVGLGLFKTGYDNTNAAYDAVNQLPETPVAAR